MNAALLRTWSPLAQELGDRIAGLTMLQASELSAYLREVHAIEPLSHAPEPIVVVDPEPDTSTDRVVQVDGYDANRKLGLIKTLREALHLGLREAKDLVEAAPKTRFGPLPLAEAEALQRRLEEAGATVRLTV